MHRVEEVHAHHLLGALGGGRHLGDRERRGIRSEDRVSRGQPIECREDLDLQLDLFRHRLDHEIRMLHGIFERARRAQPPVRRSRVRAVDLAGRDALLEQRGGLLEALLQRLAARILQQRVEPAKRRCIGDPSPHDSGAENRDPLNGHAPGPLRRAIRQTAGNASAASPALTRSPGMNGSRPWASSVS